jgi:carboxyl-terminal processing protease
VRACDFVPGKSIPAQISPDRSQSTTQTTPTPVTFSASTLDSTILAKQMDLYNRIDGDIIQYYVYAKADDANWQAIRQKYKELIQHGLSQADFYLAMKQMVSELGDGSSYFLSPNQQTGQNGVSTTSNFVGIGAETYPFSEQDQTYGVLSWVFPGSPAEKSGLKNHDMLLKVDGGSILDGTGSPRTLGPSGSHVTVTIRKRDQQPKDVSIVRSPLNQNALVDDCLVTGTRIGYIRWHDISDPAVVDQTVDALNQLSGSSSLQGLVIDKRLNASSDVATLQSLLSLFIGGELGSFVSLRPDNATPFPFTANPVTDVSGSLNLPLVVIQDQTTGDAPLFGGLLQLTRRATIVGQPADGSAYLNYVDNFLDGSALYLANRIFQPRGKTPGYWDKTGVTPDVSVSGRWDQFSEVNDPYLAKAVELLMKK